MEQTKKSWATKPEALLRDIWKAFVLDKRKKGN
jgi:hypothetical protein